LTSDAQAASAPPLPAVCNSAPPHGCSHVLRESAAPKPAKRDPCRVQPAPQQGLAHRVVPRFSPLPHGIPPPRRRRRRDSAASPPAAEQFAAQAAPANRRTARSDLEQAGARPRSHLQLRSAKFLEHFLLGIFQIMPSGLQHPKNGLQRNGLFLLTAAPAAAHPSMHDAAL